MRLKTGYYHLLAILIVVVWGTTYVATKELIRHGLTPQDIFLYRFTIAYIGIWLISPRRLFTAGLADELWMAAAGFFGGSLYFYTENTALGITQASNVAFLLCTAPLFTTFLSLACYREDKVTKGLIYGSVLALVGVAMVVFDGNTTLKVSPAGDLLTLLAAFSWAVYSLIIRRMTGRYPIVFITRKVFFYGLVTILPLYLMQPPHDAMGELLSDTKVWGSLLFLAVVASLGCFVLWNVLLKKLGTVRASNYIYFSPLVTLAASSVILQERMSLLAMTGAACIMLGVYLAEKFGTDKAPGVGGRLVKN